MNRIISINQFYITTLGLLALILFHACEKPDRNNPWDDEATFDQQQYAPKNLAIETNSATQVTLSWDYDEIEPGGFAIARRENDDSWTEDFATTQQKTFTDTNVNLLANSYEYRVHTFYNANTSSATEIKIAPPSVTTQPVTEILAQSAKSGGIATEGIELEIIGRGVVWSIQPNPVVPETKQSIESLITKTENAEDENITNPAGNSLSPQRNGAQDPDIANDSSDLKTDEMPKEETGSGYSTDGEGAGTYESELTNLNPGTEYYVRAYVRSSVGVHYGDEKTFTTGTMPPIVTTGEITEITGTTAVASGNVLSTGGSALTARGIVYRQSPNPTIADNIVLSEGGPGAFTVQLTQLQAGTTYYVRAFATNSEGTSYGEDVSFSTANGLPTVTSNSVTDISGTSATGGGNVISSGGLPVTERGVAWSTSPNPGIWSSHMAAGSGTGSFAVPMTGLSHGTTYFVRAYATNIAGTAYGSEVTFVAGVVSPTVTTNTVQVLPQHPGAMLPLQAVLLLPSVE